MPSPSGWSGSAAGEVLLSYALFGFGAQLKVDWTAFSELFGVGRHFLVIGICSYAMIQGDNLIVGAMLGTTMLGYYLIAYKLVDLPLRLAFQVTNRVGFKAYQVACKANPRACSEALWSYLISKCLFCSL